MGSGVGRSLARRSVIWGAVLLAAAAAALAVACPAHAWTAPAQASSLLASAAQSETVAPCKR